MASSQVSQALAQGKRSTDYTQATFNYQHHSRKKASSLLGRGIGLTVGGVVIVLVVSIGSAYFQSSGQSGGNMIVGVGGLIGVAFFIYGISMLFKAIFGKKRSVTCPYCSTSHTLVQSARTYICDECGHVLRLNGSEKDLVKVTCPHCQLEWAASPNTGKTICHSCGASASIANGVAQFSPETIACKSCGAANPAGSYFCWTCGSMLTAPLPVEALKFESMSESYSVKPNADGMDAISIRVNTPVGQVYMGITQLNYAISKANALPEGAAFNYGLVASLESGLSDIEDALDQKPEYAESVRGLLAGTYPLIASLLKGIKQSPMDLAGFTNSNKYWVNFSANVNRLVAKANPGVNLTLERLGLPKTLVVLKSGKSVGSSNPPVYAASITNEDELRDWVKALLPAQPMPALKVPPAVLKA